MTNDYSELIKTLWLIHPQPACMKAAEAIEALVAENKVLENKLDESCKSERWLWDTSSRKYDALKAENAALRQNFEDANAKLKERELQMCSNEWLKNNRI
jgi:hypothetical protein